MERTGDLFMFACMLMVGLVEGKMSPIYTTLFETVNGLSTVPFTVTEITESKWGKSNGNRS